MFNRRLLLATTTAPRHVRRQRARDRAFAFVAAANVRLAKHHGSSPSGMYSTYGGKGQFADAKGKGKGKGGGKGGGKGDAKGGGKGKGVGKALSFNNLPWFCKKCKFTNVRGALFCSLCAGEKSLVQGRNQNDSDSLQAKADAALQKNKKLIDENKRLRQSLKSGKTWVDAVKGDDAQSGAKVGADAKQSDNHKQAPAEVQARDVLVPLEGSSKLVSKADLYAMLNHFQSTCGQNSPMVKNVRAALQLAHDKQNEQMDPEALVQTLATNIAKKEKYIDTILERQNSILAQIQELQDKCQENEATLERERDQLEKMQSRLEAANARKAATDNQPNASANQVSSAVLPNVLNMSPDLKHLKDWMQNTYDQVYAIQVEAGWKEPVAQSMAMEYQAWDTAVQGLESFGEHEKTRTHDNLSPEMLEKAKRAFKVLMEQKKKYLPESLTMYRIAADQEVDPFGDDATFGIRSRCKQPHRQQHRPKQRHISAPYIYKTDDRQGDFEDVNMEGIPTRSLDWDAIRVQLEAQRKSKNQKLDDLPTEEQMARLDPQDHQWTKMYFAVAHANSEVAHRMVDYSTYMEGMRAAKRQKSEQE